MTNRSVEIARFMTRAQALDATLKETGKTWSAGKLWALHTDVVLGYWLFERMHEEMLAQEADPPGEPRSLYGKPEHGRLVVVTKALVYFIRAYQDGLAGVARDFSGRTWGQYPRMEEELRREPVARLVKDDESLSDYPDWFRGWRGARNDLKLGLGNITRKSGGRTVVEFWKVSREGKPETCLMSVGPRDLDQALRLSAAMTEALIREARRVSQTSSQIVKPQAAPRSPIG